MGTSLSREMKLAKRLQNLCDDRGRETNPEESAKILHEFGLLYMGKSPDKVSLIHSAAFFNAAILRDPLNKDLKANLKDLCSLILQEAKAVFPNSDLCSIANEALELVQEMRTHTDESLSKLSNVPSKVTDEELRNLEESHVRNIRQLQSETTTRYVNLMDFIAKKSIDVMGPRQCRYSITGMGSLARKEITPFSDFEHIILLEEGVQNECNYEDILEYFRWVSVIFHIIVINLKETIIRSVAVPWLNDDSIAGGDWFFDAHTPVGIKFDGMLLPACKIPLGRTRETDNKPFTIELIKPISEMAKFLELEEDIKNGYHLADVLTKTCFVSGYRSIHDQFQEHVKQALTSKLFCSNELIFEDIKHYFKDFDATLYSYDFYGAFTCDIKRVLYRTSSLFISALGRLHSIDSCSCFDIIDILHNKQLICDTTKHKLLYMMSISCAVRLKIYMMKNGQDDIFENRPKTFEFDKAKSQLENSLGEQSFGDYFVITFSLQKAMLSRIEFPWKWTDLEISLYNRFAFFYNLFLHDRVFREWENYVKRGATEKSKEDTFIRYVVAQTLKVYKRFEEALPMFIQLNNEDELDLKIKGRIIEGQSKCLYGLHRYKEAIDNIAQAKDKLDGFAFSSEDYSSALGAIAYTEGLCKRNLSLHHEAIVSFSKALKCYSASTVPGDEGNVAKCHLQIGTSLHEVRKLKEAVESLNAALAMFQQQQLVTVKTFQCHLLLGNCFLKMGQISDAMKNFVKALERRRELIPEDKHGSDSHIINLNALINRLRKAFVMENLLLMKMRWQQKNKQKNSATE